MSEAEKAESFDDWRTALAERRVLEENPPAEPDPTEWMLERQDAMEEICREAGLRMRLDL